jgi:hypothetical protein
MIGNPIGRSDLKAPADFVNRWSKALLANGLEEKIVNFFLPGGERREHGADYTEINFSKSRPRSIGHECLQLCHGLRGVKRNRS